jgi:hypothetical protein
MPVGSAHETSLGLTALLRRVDGVGTSDAFEVVRSYLEEHELLLHIQPSILFDQGLQKLELETRSSFGAMVLTDMLEFEHFPCPDGACEFVNATCRWCGGWQR